MNPEIEKECSELLNKISKEEIIKVVLREMTENKKVMEMIKDKVLGFFQEKIILKDDALNITFVNKEVSMLMSEFIKTVLMTLTLSKLEPLGMTSVFEVQEIFDRLIKDLEMKDGRNKS